MSTVISLVLMLHMISAVPGETTGWGTGEVSFIAYADTDEHHDIYPIGAGQYLISATIIQIESDPADILSYVTSLEICYDGPLDIRTDDILYISGIYYNGACPIPYCRRVAATTIYETGYPDIDDEEPYYDPDIRTPTVYTSSAEATETTATLRGILINDGHDYCRCRFSYYKNPENIWTTEWIYGLRSGFTFSQEIAGLEPDTLYYYSVEARNSAEYYSSGRTGSFRTLPETIAPIPNPVLWLNEPDQIDAYGIIMTSDIARDAAGPEEYFYDFVSSPTGGAGGSDSIWTFYPTYTDLGLNPNHQYGYRVKGRDGLGNETIYSITEYAYTDIETPENIEFGEITTNSIQVKSSGTLSGLDRGQSGLKLENTTAGRVSSWQQNNNFWTSEDLLSNTRYGFRAQARNGDGDVTSFSPLQWAYTCANKPVINGFSNVTTSNINIHWNFNGNPIYTQYWCENTVNQKNSGWFATNQWIDTDLSANTQYSYRIKARNGDGLETEFTDTIQKYSAIESPTGVTFGNITSNSIQVNSENTPSGLNRDNSGLRFENISAGRMSSWQQNNNYWTSEGLLPNQCYSFRAQARNGDAEQSAPGNIGSIYTLANIPASPTFAGITTANIQVNWAPNGNPANTLYICENTTSGTSSGTTILTAWNCTNLQPNTQYSFRVKAQNAAGIPTGFSTATQKYSAIETPEKVSFGQITSGSIEVKSQNVPTGLDRGNSGLRFENYTSAALSQWQQNNNYWNCTGLSPNSMYVFRAQARNGDGDETPYGSTLYTYTLASIPAPAGFSYVTDNTIQVDWNANSNPYGTLYLCENITTGESSGWIISTSWENFDLDPFTAYSYRVKAKNVNGIETAWVNLGQQITGYRSVSFETTEGGHIIEPGENIFQFAPDSTVHIKAVADEGYHFLQWSGSAVDAGRVEDPKASETTVLVDAHYRLVANFLRTNIYVDAGATGLNDGSTWQNAFPTLQDALDVAQAGNHILVAQGLYTPDAGQNYNLGDFSATFNIPNGVILKGGYSGLGNSNPDDRDINLYESILSGDLNGDDNSIDNVFDLYTQISRLDNSLHIVTAQDTDSSTVLEGFTIKGGNCFYGAGIQLFVSDMTIKDCTIKENRAGFEAADGTIGWGEGAGIYCYLGNPEIKNCIFYNNWVGGKGGALYNLYSNPVIINCSFINNSAGTMGGGIYNKDSNLILTDSVFQGNWSSDGGGIYIVDQSDCRVTNSMFMGNAGQGKGGAVFSAGISLEMINCVLSGNLAFDTGGAITIAQGTAMLTNCTLNRNIANNYQGSAALLISDSDVTLANCILWDNTLSTQSQIILSTTENNNANLSISYCNVLSGENGITRTEIANYTWGQGNINSNPKFRDVAGDDNIIGTLDDDLRIAAGSPCIDSGSNMAVPQDRDDIDLDDDTTERIPVDISGNSRFIDDLNTVDTGIPDIPFYPQIIDIGAYEY